MHSYSNASINRLGLACLHVSTVTACGYDGVSVLNNDDAIKIARGYYDNVITLSYYVKQQTGKAIT